MGWNLSLRPCGNTPIVLVSSRVSFMIFKDLPMIRLMLVGCFAFFVAASPVFAQNGEPRLLAKYSDWSAYMFIENGNKVCYMISQPKAQEGNYTKRGKIYALVTNRPAEGTSSRHR